MQVYRSFWVYPGGFFAFGYAFPDRLVCDRLRALYLGDGGESLFYDIGAVRFRCATAELIPVF